MIRGFLGLAHHVTVEALKQPGAQKRDLARCKALFVAGQLGSWMGRYDEAHTYLEESLAIARENGARPWVARVLQPLGFACLGQGNADAARQYFEEAVDLAREVGDKRELAAAINALAQLRRVEGATQTAESLYKQVLALARELQDRESTAIALLNLAMVSIGQGFGAEAKKMLLEVSAIAQEMGSRLLGQSMLEVSAGLAVIGENWADAARLYGAAQAQAEHTGLHRDPIDEAFLAPLIARARKVLGDTAFDAAEMASRGIGYEQAIINACAWLETSSGRDEKSTDASEDEAQQ